MHWRSKMRNVTLFFLFGVLFFAGCAGVVGPKQPQECSERLYGVKWQVVMINNDPVSLAKAPYIRFAKDGKIGGFGGCNSFFGEVSVTETAIDFIKIGATRRFCAGVGGETERRLFSILKGVKWWQFDEDDNLVIFDDEVRLILKKSAG